MAISQKNVSSYAQQHLPVDKNKLKEVKKPEQLETQHTFQTNTQQKSVQIKPEIAEKTSAKKAEKHRKTEEEEFKLEDIPLCERDIDLLFLFNNQRSEYPSEIKSAVPGTYYLVKIAQLLHLVVACSPFLFASFTAYQAAQLTSLSFQQNISLVLANILCSLTLIFIGIITTRYYWAKIKHSIPLEIVSKETDAKLYYFVNQIAKCCNTPKPLQIAINLSNTVEIHSLKNRKNGMFKETQQDYMLIIGLTLFKTLDSTELAALIAYKMSYYSNANTSIQNIMDIHRKFELNLTFPDKVDYITENNIAGYKRILHTFCLPFIYLERALTRSSSYIIENTIQRITQPLNVYSLENAITLCGMKKVESAFTKSKSGQIKIQTLISKTKAIKLKDAKNPVDIAMETSTNKEHARQVSKQWDRKIKDLIKNQNYLSMKHMQCKFKRSFTPLALLNSYNRIGKQITENYLIDQNISPKICKQLSTQWFDTKQDWRCKNHVMNFFNSQFRKNRVIIPSISQDEVGSIMSMKLSLQSHINQIREDFPHWSSKLVYWDNLKTPYLDKALDDENRNTIVELQENLKQSEQLFSNRMGTALSIQNCFNSSGKSKEIIPLIDICNLYERNQYKIDQLFLHTTALKKLLAEKNDVKQSNRKLSTLISLQQELAQSGEAFPSHKATHRLLKDIKHFKETSASSNEDLLERSTYLISAFESAYVRTIKELVNQCDQIEKKLKLNPIKIN